MTIIRSTISGGAQTTSRDDAAVGDLVTLSYAGTGTPTTYAWSLEYVPVDADGNSSTATIATPTLSTASFTVDLPGAYLVRLAVDVGTGTEVVETVRIRAITAAGFYLTAAGERRDSDGPVPTDAVDSGWADDINRTLAIIDREILRRTPLPTGALYVDPVGGLGVFQTIQEALDSITTSDLVTIYLAPGVYAESPTITNSVALVGATTPDFLSTNPYINQSFLPVSISGAVRVEGTGFLSLSGIRVANFTGALFVADTARCQVSNCFVVSANSPSMSVEDTARVQAQDSVFASVNSFAVSIAAGFDGNVDFIRCGFLTSLSAVTSATDVAGSSVTFIQCDFRFVIGGSAWTGYVDVLTFDNCVSVTTIDYVPPGNVTSGEVRLRSTVVNTITTSPDIAIPRLFLSGGASVDTPDPLFNLFLSDDSRFVAYGSSSRTSLKDATTVEAAFDATVDLAAGAWTTITTSDATPSFGAQGDPGYPAICLQATVTAYENTLAQHAVFVLTAMITTDGLGVVAVGPAGVQNDFTDAPAGWSATIDTDGSQWRVIVTGAAATTINWTVRTRRVW